MAAREAYFLYVERVAEGANAADGPFSALERVAPRRASCYDAAVKIASVEAGLRHPVSV